MRLDDDIYYLKQELADVKEESMAMLCVRELKKTIRILCIIIFALIALLAATGMYLIYILNDIGTEEITTESYEIEQDAEGSNNFVNGNNNEVNNG